MNPVIGWGLAAAGIAAGYVGWGWPGVLLGFSVVVFWLLLQFSRSLRVLRNAGSAPVGHVDEAVHSGNNDFAMPLPRAAVALTTIWSLST